MAIVLKYGPVGSIIQAGAAAGIGHRNALQAEDALKIWQQQQYQNFQGQQSALHRQQQAALQQQNQNFQADQNAQSQYNDVLRLRAQTAYQDKTLAQQQQHYNDLQHQTILNDLATGKKVLPGSAQKELKQLEEGMVLMQGPGYTDEQRAQFQKDHDAKYRALIGTAVPNMNTAASEINKNLVHVDPQDRVFDKPQVDPETGLKTTTAFLGGKPLIDHSAEQKAAAKQAEKAKVESEKQQKEAADAAKKQADTFKTESAAYAKAHHAKAEQIQKANPILDAKGNDTGKLKPLSDFKEQAAKELADFGITPPQPPAQPAPAPAAPVQGQSGEVPGPTTPAGTFSGEPAVNQTFTGSTAGGPGTYGQPVQQSSYTPEAIQESLKAYPNLPPEVAKGITPELVGKMEAAGAQDPVKAAIAYHTITKDGSLTTADKSQQTMYPPERRKAVLENSRLPRPQSAEEMNALPKGAAFVAPDGTIRRKP